MLRWSGGASMLVFSQKNQIKSPSKGDNVSNDVGCELKKLEKEVYLNPMNGYRRLDERTKKKKKENKCKRKKKCRD
jgi:hypothetical protein